MGLTQKPSGAWNLQSNAILERVHQVLGDCLRSFNLDNQELDQEDPFEKFLTASAYAMRITQPLVFLLHSWCLWKRFVYAC